MREPFKSYDDCDIPEFLLAPPPPALPALPAPPQLVARACTPILRPNIPAPFGLYDCPTFETELELETGSLEGELILSPKTVLGEGDPECVTQLKLRLRIPDASCPTFEPPDAADFEAGFDENIENPAFSVEITLDNDPESEVCNFRLSGDLKLPPYPCGLADAAFSNADIQYTDGDPSFDFEAVEAAECTFRAIIRLPSPGCPEFGEPETGDFEATFDESTDTPEFNVSISPNDDPESEGCNFKVTGELKLPPYPGCPEFGEPESGDFEATFDESIDTPAFSVSISPNDDPEGEGCNFKVTGELKLPPYPDGSTVDCIQPFKLIGPLGNENEAIVDVSTTTVSVADIEAVIAALVSITPNVPYTVLVGFDTRTEDEDPNPIPYESPFAAYIYENPGLDVRIEQSGAYADGEWVENAFDREFYVPAVMLWFNSEGDITECQQLNESATYIRMKTRNTLDGFYIYLANGDEEFVSMETAMAGYDPDPGGANHTNWSLEVKVNAMAIRPFNTHPPVGTHETARHDGDASTTPPTAQEVCRIPIIRDGMRISAGGVYRENIYCAGSKGHNVELLGAG